MNFSLVKNLIKSISLFEFHQKNRRIPNEPDLFGYFDVIVQGIRVNHKNWKILIAFQILFLKWIYILGNN